VLLLAHGTPDTIEQIPEYLRNVVSGRPIPQHVVEEIQHRYSLIGHSPLTELTMEQGKLVEAELAASGEPVAVYVGMRNWRPYISDVVKQMRADGVEEAAVICMAPQNSRTSVGLYRRAVHAEAGLVRIDFTEGWARHPLLAEAFAERLRPALSEASAKAGHSVPVLFTAHSVPTRTIEPPKDGEQGPRIWPGSGADPYADDARQTAESVAALVPEIAAWHFAFQSQGASGGPWIGPTVEETLDKLAAEGATAVVLQPIGFLCDHVEILYDVDIAFREYAKKLGIALSRPESLNGSPTLARAVAELAHCGLQRLRS
jgi:ferrochelatase